MSHTLKIEKLIEKQELELANLLEGIEFYKNKDDKCGLYFCKGEIAKVNEFINDLKKLLD